MVGGKGHRTSRSGHGAGRTRSGCRGWLQTHYPSQQSCRYTDCSTATHRRRAFFRSGPSEFRETYLIFVVCRNAAKQNTDRQTELTDRQTERLAAQPTSYRWRTPRHTKSSITPHAGHGGDRPIKAADSTPKSKCLDPSTCNMQHAHAMQSVSQSVCVRSPKASASQPEHAVLGIRRVRHSMVRHSERAASYGESRSDSIRYQ